MRIPVPIAITACLLTTVLVWLIGTHDKNFTRPPTPEELVQLAEAWEKAKPDIPPPQGSGSINPASGQGEQPKPAAIRPSPELEKLPDVNLIHSPALSEFGTLGDKGGALLARLATHLETNGHYQHALLAWERVIDMANPTDDERLQAAAAIRRLKPTLPPWNTDPANDIPLILHAGATLEEREILEQALSSAAKMISDASGNVITVSTKASIGNTRALRTKLIPVAIWFSRPGASTEEAPAETPPISFMANPGQQDILARQILVGAYSLLRAHLARETNFSPLPENPDSSKPHDLINHHITRLMWREFVNSLKQ